MTQTQEVESLFRTAIDPRQREGAQVLEVRSADRRGKSGEETPLSPGKHGAGLLVSDLA